MSMLDTHDNAPAHGRSEEMFLAWFFSLPVNTDVAEAARIEIARIDKAARPCEQVARLRTMLVQASFLNRTCRGAEDGSAIDVIRCFAFTYKCI